MNLIDDAALTRLSALNEKPLPGDVVDGRYELRGWLGEGAMGVVFVAWDRQAQREVALKRIPLQDPDARARFAREARTLATLTQPSDHVGSDDPGQNNNPLSEQTAYPALLRYLDHGEFGGACYLISERLHGVTLAERLANDGALSISETIRLGGRISAALTAVHDIERMHRDLKPSNLFLIDGDVKKACLIDFGLTRAVDAGMRITTTGALVGTPGYMAPEQVRGEKQLSCKVDIFALGCVLYECLCGEPAFVAEGSEALLAKLLLESPRSIAERMPNVPPELEELIMLMLSKSKRERPNARALSSSFEALDIATTDAVKEDAGFVPKITLATGSIIAEKYRVEESLGIGGMGMVFKARHLELGKNVAIKVMRRTASKSDETRFIREAQATSQLESKHALTVLDVSRLANGAPYMVMEYLRGQDLAAKLIREGPLSVDEAVHMMNQVCAALSEAHRLGIVHRDLKPANLFSCEQREGPPLIKVLDFGISKITKPIAALDQLAVKITAPTAVVGSAAYMSPEQLRGAEEVDLRSDIWALGVVLHELLSGELPFAGKTPASIGAQIASATPRKLRQVLPAAPAGLETVILRCLEKDPAARYADVAAFKAALNRAAPSQAAVSPIEPNRAALPQKRSWSLVLGLAIAAAGAALFSLRGHYQQSESHASTEPVNSSPTAVAEPRDVAKDGATASAKPTAKQAPTTLATVIPSNTQPLAHAQPIESAAKRAAQPTPTSPLAKPAPTHQAPPNTAPPNKAPPNKAPPNATPPPPRAVPPPPAPVRQTPPPAKVDVANPVLDAW